MEGLRTRLDDIAVRLDIAATALAALVDLAEEEGLNSLLFLSQRHIEGLASELNEILKEG